jgi:hypothetical protein
VLLSHEDILSSEVSCLRGEVLQVHLIAQASAERLDSPGRIVAAAVEAPVDRLLLAGARPAVFPVAL